MKTTISRTLVMMAAIFVMTSVWTTALAQKETPIDNTRVKKETAKPIEKKQTRDEFIKEIKEEIKALEAKIEKLKAEAVERKRDQTVEYNKIIDALKAKSEKLDAEIKSFKKTSEEKIHKAKKEIRSAFKKVEAEYQKLMDEVKKKGEISEPK